MHLFLSYFLDRQFSDKSHSLSQSIEKIKDGSKSPVKNGSIENNKKGRLTEGEKSETGSVKMSVYLKYFKSIGTIYSIAILSCFILANVCNAANSLWLSAWANDATDPKNLNDTDLRNYRLGVYGGIGVCEVVLMLFASVSLNIACVNAAKKLHNNMLGRILRAPMSFFGKINLFAQRKKEANLIFSFQIPHQLGVY